LKYESSNLDFTTIYYIAIILCN